MLLSLLVLFADVVSAHPGHHVVAETATIRTFFYVGGGYSDDGNGGHIFKDQMYVEKLAPITRGATTRVPLSSFTARARLEQIS